MGEQDRRKAPRLDANVPVKFRPTEGVTPYAFTGESINVSERGLFFSVGNPIKAGSEIELSFMMPGEVTGGLPMRIRCTARVIRVEDAKGPEGKIGVAAHIERFETIVAES